MKFILPILLASILLVASITGCGQNGDSGGRLVIATSIEPLAGFIEKIGGDGVDVLVMVPVGADPHTYEPRPSQMKALSKAAAYFSVDAGLEFGLVYMNKLSGINPDMLVVKCSQGVDLISGSGHDGEEGETFNPHYWLSPRIVLRIVDTICSGLIQVDPDNRSFYEQNRDQYLDEIQKLDDDISAGLSGVLNRRFMVFHPAWTYFAREYDLQEIAIEVEGKEPSAQALVHLIDEARAYNIKVVFASLQFSQKSAEYIAQSIGGRVVLVDGLARDYIPNMRYMLGEMLAAME